MRGQNQAETKQKNKNLIWKLLITRAPVSRVELSRLTGLTKMAVTNIIGELMEEGIVREAGLSDTHLGRKPICLEVADGARHVIGAYISRDSICCVLGDLKGTVLRRHEAGLQDEDNASLVKKLTRLIDRTKQGADRVIGIGISCIGPLSAGEGMILNPPNFYKVNNLSLVSQLRQVYDMPVFLENDMNTSALAERYFGKAKNIDDFIYVGVSNGIGAGIVAGGRLYAGDCGFGGEIGHITVEPNGRKCACGNAGCLEMYASFPKNWSRLNKAGRARALETICRYLSVGLITLINLFDPKIIYIGHDIALAGGDAPRLLSEMTATKFISSLYKQIPVEQSAFGKEAPVYGAIALCIDRLLG